MDDLDLIDGCLKNDRQCQKKLYDKFSPALFAVCKRYSNCESDAEDILADGFVSIFKSLNTFQKKSSLFYWMKSIIVKTAIDYFRKNKKHYNNLPIEDNISLLPNLEESKIYTKIDAHALIEIIKKMPDEWRIIFNMRIIEDLSFKEIANELNKNENTVRVYFLRGKTWLSEQLKHE